MKIDKKNPRHWLALVLLGLNTLAAIVLRPFASRRPPHLVLFYGHKLNGNLLALYRYLRTGAVPQLRPVFLGIDRAHVEELQRAGEAAVLGTAPEGLRALVRCAAIVSSHGLHSMQPLVRFSSIRFVDVWHGIPFKGFDGDDFRVLRRYHEAWVASRLHRQLFIDRFSFRPERVHVTGYARTDRLVTRHEDPAALRCQYGAPPSGKLVLYAPTWKQDAQGRSLYPFGHDERTFLDALAAVAGRHGATILMRAHQNSGAAWGSGYTNVVSVPAATLPDSEGLLLISDVLICDWSSIAFDFLVLDRPTLFLEVPSPFKKGFSLGPEYRFGPVLDSLDGLLAELDRALGDPEGYRARFGDAHRRVHAQVYEEFCDGRASERGCARLLALIEAEDPASG